MRKKFSTQTARQISRISTRKGPNYKNRLKKQYRVLLQRTGKILRRAKTLCETIETEGTTDIGVIAQVSVLKEFIERTEQVRFVRDNRVVNREYVVTWDTKTVGDTEFGEPINGIFNYGRSRHVMFPFGG
jgi:hypothetical protein